MTIAGADFSCDVRISDSEALCAFVASSTNAASAEANVEVAFEEGSHLGGGGICMGPSVSGRNIRACGSKEERCGGAKGTVATFP